MTTPLSRIVLFRVNNIVKHLSKSDKQALWSSCELLNLKHDYFKRDVYKLFSTWMVKLFSVQLQDEVKNK